MMRFSLRGRVAASSSVRAVVRSRVARASACLLAFLAVASASACGAGRAKYASAPVAASDGAAPAPLDRSVFARDPQGQLTEENLQKILSTPLELDLPARVGVLPIMPAQDWRGPGPDYAMAPTAVAGLVSKLRGSEPFTLVTEMMPIPSGALGMEALREMAARYKLRYIVLYREHVERWKRANPWVVGYATIVGALFLPGDTLRVGGYVEASMFDVKTGLLLFTVRRRVSGKRTTNAWHTGDKLAEMQRAVAIEAAPELAVDLRKAVFRFAEAATVENARTPGAERTAAAPAASDQPAALAEDPATPAADAAPPIATDPTPGQS